MTGKVIYFINKKERLDPLLSLPKYRCHVYSGLTFKVQRNLLKVSKDYSKSETFVKGSSLGVI